MLFVWLTEKNKMKFKQCSFLNNMSASTPVIILCLGSYICSSVFKECAASIFMVTEFCSPGKWSEWKEEIGQLYRKVARTVKTEEGIRSCRQLTDTDSLKWDNQIQSPWRWSSTFLWNISTKDNSTWCNKPEDFHFNYTCYKRLKTCTCAPVLQNTTCKRSIQYISRCANFDKLTGRCTRLKSPELKYPPLFTSL
jgi:hypothetical protein